MGKRGRTPKPNRLRVLEGTYRKDRHGDIDEEVSPPRPKRLTTPTYLGAKGKAVWRRLSPQLQELGLMTANDTDLFGMYCRQHDIWHQAMTTLADDPTDMDAFKRHQSAAEQINKLGAKFGLSPSDRNGLATEVSKVRPTVAKARQRG